MYTYEALLRWLSSRDPVDVILCSVWGAAVMSGVAVTLFAVWAWTRPLPVPSEVPVDNVIATLEDERSLVFVLIRRNMPSRKVKTWHANRNKIFHDAQCGGGWAIIRKDYSATDREIEVHLPRRDC